MTSNTTAVKKGLRWAAGAALLAVAVFAARSRPLGAQELAFRGGVDMVVLNVAVTDKTGRQAPDLESGDFSVFEDGRKQNVALFQKANVPLAVTMLMDVSDSMALCLDMAQKAAAGFVRLLGPADVASVIPFEQHMHEPVAFTGDQTQLEQAIRHTSAKGATALYDTVYIALRELQKMSLQRQPDSRPQRQAVLLLTDGIDSASLMSVDDMLDAAGRSDAAIYVIRLPAAPNARTGVASPQFVLGRLAQQTGGRVYMSEEPGQFAGIFKQIKAELSGQYLVAYRSDAQPRDGRFHQVVVRLERPGLSARTRPGYFASANSRF